AAGGLRSDVAVLRGAGAVADWSGRAATMFAGSVRGLPRDLTLAAESYDTVAQSLVVHAAELRAAQRHARRADEQLGHLDGLLLIDRHLAGPSTDEQAAAARTARIAAYEQEAQDIRRRLGAVVDHAELSASVAARRVRAASDAPREPPNPFERLVGAAADWVDDHSDLLAGISAVLKGVVTVAGTLALVPALAPVCGPIAIGAGIAALAVDAALAWRRRASWVGVGVDAALTAVPAARPAQAAVREVRTRLGSVVVYRVEGTPNARVVIDHDNNVRFQKRSMLYINVGDKARAEQYYRRKLADGLPGVQIKSFRVSKRAFRELKFRAVEQERARGFPRAPHLVDTKVAANQFGLWKADFRELEKHIVPGSGRVLR
ncbi:MAG: hypothetical protein ACRDWY_11940, partial [Actinomycetes bacterium]